MQIRDPRIQTVMPYLCRLRLYIRNHDCKGVGNSVMPRLEALDSTGRCLSVVLVLAFIPVFVLGRRQTLALNWLQGIELSAPSAFNPDRRATGGSDPKRNRCHSRIDLGSLRVPAAVRCRWLEGENWDGQRFPRAGHLRSEYPIDRHVASTSVVDIACDLALS